MDGVTTSSFVPNAMNKVAKDARTTPESGNASLPIEGTAMAARRGTKRLASKTASSKAGCLPVAGGMSTTAVVLREPAGGDSEVRCITCSHTNKTSGVPRAIRSKFVCRSCRYPPCQSCGKQRNWRVIQTCGGSPWRCRHCLFAAKSTTYA